MIQKIIEKLYIPFVRVVIGLLFTFSGFAKAVDPMGSSIKFEEYFISFGMEWLGALSLVFAVLLSTLEMTLGLMMLLGLFRRFTAWVSTLFMLFFTILTIYIYHSSPVEDCGCFGDALILSNGETLLKNLIFTILLIPYLLNYKSYRDSSNTCRRSSIITLVAIIVSIAPSIYAIVYLPIIDFLPYKVGVNIPQAMSIPEGEKEDVYDTILVYKNINSGDLQDFSVEDTTWHDNSKWSYIDTKTELVVKGYEPEISNFNIFDVDGFDVTQQMLSSGQRVAIIVIDSRGIPQKVAENIVNIDIWCADNDTRLIVFSRFNISELKRDISDIVGYDFNNVYNGDHTLIKSFIRAPYGLVVLGCGTIKAKHNLKRMVDLNSIKYPIY